MKNKKNPQRPTTGAYKSALEVLRVLPTSDMNTRPTALKIVRNYLLASVWG